MDNLPSNSHSEKKREPEVEKVITGEVRRRKASLGKRFKETFTGGDAQSVGQYIIFEVMIPALKNLVVDAGQEALQRIVLGDSRGPSYRRPSSSTGHISYNRFSTPIRREEPRREVTRRARAMHDFDEIILDTRVEAENVLDNLYNLIDKYGQATVTHLYDMVGITPAFTDDKYGWTELTGSRVLRSRDGFLLDIPRPEPLTS